MLSRLALAVWHLTSASRLLPAAPRYQSSDAPKEKPAAKGRPVAVAMLGDHYTSQLSQPLSVSMSKKRDFVAKLFPAGIPLSKSVNDNAVFVEMRRTRFAACPEFSDRPALYEYISDMISGPIDYL